MISSTPHTEEIEKDTEDKGLADKFAAKWMFPEMKRQAETRAKWNNYVETINLRSVDNRKPGLGRCKFLISVYQPCSSLENSTQTYTEEKDTLESM